MATAPVQEEFQAILDHVADAVTVQSTDGSLVYANQAAVELLGCDTLEALLAMRPEELRSRVTLRSEDGGELVPDQLPGRRVLRGEEAEPTVIRWRPVGSRVPERWSRVKARALRDPSGRVRMAVNVIEDITELKINELGHRFLAEAGRVLASSLDYEDTLRRVAQLAVPEVADWCVVDLATRDGFERVALTHIDPQKVAFVEELTRRYPQAPDAPRGTPNVLRTGASELYPLISDELLQETAQSAEHLELLRSVGFVSAMVVPLLAREEVLGAVTLVSAESAREFGPDDLTLAEELGRRAGVAIQNARLYRQRSEIARVLQASLLPPVLPEIEGIETAAAFRAAGDGVEVGGDFYDLFPASEDSWFAVIGDVCGKGTAAAATTALVRYTIRAAAVRRSSPAAILGWLNEATLREFSRDRRFCTLVVARLDVAADGVRVTVASGGHPLPRLLRATGTVERLGRAGTLIGVTHDLSVEDRSAELRDGDTLLLYTDGLTEAGAPGRVWADEDVDAAIRDAARREGLQDVVDGMIGAALREEATPSRDDLAVLALRARRRP